MPEGPAGTGSSAVSGIPRLHKGWSLKMSEEKIKSVRRTKPTYNLWQNSAYMIGLAWKEQKNVLWLCLVMAALTVATNLLGLFIAPTVLAQVQAAVPLRTLLLSIAGFSAALIVLGAAKAYVTTNTLFGRIALRCKILMKILDKLSKTSYPNTEDQGVKKKFEKAGMAIHDNSSAAEAVWTTLTEILQNTAGFCIYLALLANLNPVLVAVTLATTIPGYFIGKHVNGWGYRHRDEESEYIHKMNYIDNTAEDYTIGKDIRIFGMRGWLMNIYDSGLRLYQAFAARREKVAVWGNVADAVFAFLRNGIAYAVLIGMTLRNSLSAPQFLLYFTAVGGFTEWVTGILSGFSKLHTQSLDLSATREFLELPEPFRFEEGKPLEPDPAGRYEITLRNLTFRYPGAEKDTLKKIDLTVKAGEKLAVVGLNGAGKTTLIRLICGFYDPTEGEVLLNGKNIKKYNRRDYYRHFSAVFQQFSLLPMTIAENIAQTDRNIDMDRVRACAQKAGLTEKIESLPRGYGTHLGKEVYEDGIELSGGETQRLMLARALYKNAPVIMLDEPTAALDPIAESDIYQRYGDLTGGRTSIYISHRLASTRFCDRIILLENGVIAEEGTHDELLRKGGRYAELFEIQSRYYREGGTELEKAFG